MWLAREEDAITDWLGTVSDEGKYQNLELWQGGKRKQAIEKLIKATKISHRSDRVGSKVEQMFVKYKKWRDKIATTGWGALAPDDAIGDGETKTVKGKVV